MKVTYQKFLEIYNILTHQKIEKEDKFHDAVISLLLEYKVIVKKYHQLCFNINLKCSYEEPGTLIVPKDAQGNFLYTKEGRSTRETELRTLNEETQVEIPVCIIPLTADLKSRLDLYSIAMLRGVLFENRLTNEPLIQH